jgi:hypothetical protein
VIPRKFLTFAELRVLYVGIVLGGLLGMAWGRFVHLPFVVVVVLFVLSSVSGYRFLLGCGRWRRRQRREAARQAGA